MKNAELYTRSIQGKIKCIAVNASIRTGGAVDADELFSAGECEVAKALADFDPTKHDNFEGWACQRAQWGMRGYLRSIDPVSKNRRQKGDKSNPMVHTDAQPVGFLDFACAAVAPDRGEAADEARHLLKCLEQLPERERRIVWAYYMGRQNMRKISAREGCTHQRIQQILRKALKKLRGSYEGRAQPIPPLRIVKTDIRPEQVTA